MMFKIMLKIIFKFLLKANQAIINIANTTIATINSYISIIFNN